MADQRDVRRIARSLPEVIEGDGQFSVRNGTRHKGLVWVWMERVDLRTPRVANPKVVAIRVSGQAEKAALLASDPDKFFTESHYNGFPAVLVRLPSVDVAELRELITDAWRSQAPKALVKEFDRDR